MGKGDGGERRGGVCVGVADKHMEKSENLHSEPLIQTVFLVSEKSKSTKLMFAKSCPIGAES